MHNQTWGYVSYPIPARKRRSSGRWAYGLGTGDIGIWAIPATDFRGQCCGACAGRSSPGTDPRFAKPIFRTVHRGKSPLPSSGAQPASGRSSASTLRAGQSRALASRLCAAAQLRSAADDRIEFAAGRAVVKPACRVGQARGLRRGSAYGSFPSVHKPRRSLSIRRGTVLRPDAAGSASERKALGKPTRRPPAFFAGAPFPVLASGQTTVVLDRQIRPSE